MKWPLHNHNQPIIFVWTIDKTIDLRSDEQDELYGMDASYHGERGYDFS